MKIYIKYMVSIRCKMVVESELRNLGIEFLFVEIGSADLAQKITDEKFSMLKVAITKCGLELIEDNKSILIEQIKVVILEYVYNDNKKIKLNFSSYLEEKLNYNYIYMSNLFSVITSVSIENYIIALKIERTKELLAYNDLTLSQISYKLNYSSMAHLSSQFKKHTGLTPSSFKNIQLLKKNITTAGL